MRIVDSDQHLYEPRTLWLEHIDPARRDDALRIEDDTVGTPRLRWRGHELGIAEVQVPGRSAEAGERHRRARAGLPPRERYDDVVSTAPPRAPPTSSPATPTSCCAGRDAASRQGRRLFQRISAAAGSAGAVPR